MKLCAGLLLAAGLFGQTVVEPRIVSETLPSGGLMQIKIDLTSPHPITTTGTDYSLDSVFDSVEGVAILSPSGDAYGVAVPQGGRMRASLVSPLASLGTQLDYPYLVTAAHIRSGLTAGTVVPINFGAGLTFTGLNGESYSIAGKNGTLTIGGSVSVTNVIPGGGVVPAGTTVRLLGTGFTAQTRVDVNEAALGSQRFVSSTEIDFTLTSSIDLTGRRFRVRNPDNSEAVYYSYLRAVAVGSSTRALLNACHPLYPNGSSTSAGLVLPAPPANGFVAVALRNMGQSNSSVQLDLVSSAGTGIGTSSVSIPGAGQFMRTVQELFGNVPAGASVRITASAPVQALGLRGDDSTGAVTAFLPGAAPLINAGTLTVSPTSLTFDGSSTKTVTVGSTGSALSFTASTNAAWLSVTPSSGQTPATLNVTANASGLSAGTYTGTVTVAPGQSVAVTLNVAQAAALTVSPASLTFDGTGTRTLTVGSTGAALSFTASTNAAWLSVTPSTGQTPATLTVTANTAGLASGTYTGTVTVAPGQSVAVTLNVGPSPTLTVSPASLIFDGSGTKTVTIGSTGAALAFTASTNAAWLSVTPSTGQTPATLTVTANAAGLAPGSYTGAVTVAPGQSVAVTLNVAVAGSLTVSPSSLTFDGPGTKTVSVTSSGTPLSFTASSNAAWLTVTPSSGQTPATLNVAASAAGLSPGIYTGTVTVSPGQSVAVTLAVAATPILTVSPSSLIFEGAGTKTVSVGSTGASLSFMASASAPWLTVTPSAGQTPASLNVTANPAGLSPGSYTGTVTVSPGQSVAVTLNVPVVALTVSPGLLAFDGTGSKTVAVGSTGAALGFTASANASWLMVTPASGQTPATLTVSANAAGLAAGTYTGTVTIAPGQSVAVTLTVAPTTPVVPQVAAVVNAASQSAASLFAPGQIVTLYGGAMGPSAGAGAVLAGSGRIDTVAGGVRVLFGATPAPVLYASASQVNVIVPYEANGLTPVQVEYLGQRSAAKEIFVSAAGPAIFTQNASGRGAAAVLNQDYSLNTPASRAARGSAIMIYATGGGQTSPPSVTGEIAGTALKTTALPVTVTIGGRRIEPLYAGVAPGLVTGLLQLNVILPPDVPTGDAVPIFISVAGVSSQDGTTISIE